MDTFDAIRARRSVKWYDTEHRFTDEEEQQLLDLAKESPSSFNAQHWRVVSVKNPETRKALRAAAFDQAHVSEASLLYIICGDVKAWNEDPARYYRNAPPEIADFLLSFNQSFHTGKEELQRDEAIRSGTFFAHTLMLSAKAMGYDSCALIGFDPVAVAKIINLPENHVINFMLVIGKAVKQPWPKPGYIEQSEWLIKEQFN